MALSSVRSAFHSLAAGSVAALAVPGGVAAQAVNDPIVVTGERFKQAEIAADQASRITFRPPVDTPLARHYAPLCIKTFGIDPAYGEIFVERILRSANALGLPIGKKGCRANTWIGFSKDSAAELAALRKSESSLFSQFKSFEADRIFQGSGAAQLLHATEVRSADGRPIPIVRFNLSGKTNRGDNRTIEGRYNAQSQTGRLTTTIRNDINGTLLIFDRDRADGRTVRQLADYATMRILAPVQDFAEFKGSAAPTILHLFATGAEPPVGLMPFDWAYLAAYYKLDRGARATAVHDAVRRASLDGVGPKLEEAAE